MYPLVSNKYNVNMEQYPSDAPTFSIDDEVSTVTDMDSGECELGTIVKIDVGFDGNPAFNSRVWNYTILLNSNKVVVRDGSDLVLINNSDVPPNKFSAKQKVKIIDLNNIGGPRLDGVVVGMRLQYGHDRFGKKTPKWMYVVEVAPERYRGVSESQITAA